MVCCAQTLQCCSKYNPTTAVDMQCPLLVLLLFIRCGG